MAKWENYSFRKDDTGYVNNTSVFDPSDGTQETNVIYPATAYPTTGLNGKSFGKTGGATPIGNNASSTNAGSNPLLGGVLTNSGGSQDYQFDADPGTYDFRAALGPSTATGQVCALAFFDGTAANVIAGTGMGGWRIWSASRAITLNWFMISSIDKGVWKCTTAGTTSSTEPSGNGATFTDGTVTWTRITGWNALLVVKGTNSSTSKVIDQNSTEVNASSWSSSATQTLVISGTNGNALCTIKCDDSSQYPRQVSLRVQAAVLADVTLYDRWGDSLTSTPSFWCNEKVGRNIARIAAVNGTYNVAAFAIGGTLATYFSLSLIGSDVWLVQSTRIPDSFAGTCTLTITQTSAGDTGSPYTTSFSSCTAISSQGKATDGSGLGEMPTQQWLVRKTVFDVHAARWAGYTGQSFASDVAVTSGSALQAAISGLSPDGTSWYRIRCQNGTYTGLDASAVHKNFGTGGLLIEPDTGHDPEISCAWGNLVIAGLHVRNITSVPDASKFSSATYQWRFTDPGPSNGYFNRVKFENCRFGLLYGAGYASSDIATLCPTSVIVFEHGESCEVVNNTWYGITGAAWLFGVRTMRWTGNDYRQWGVDDLHAFNNAEKDTSTQGVFADNNCYIVISDETARDKIDYTGFSTGLHPDFAQVRTLSGTPGTTDSACYAVIENNAVNVASDLSSSSGINFIQDNNTGNNCPTYWAVYNNVIANPLTRGIGAGDGEVWAYRNTMVPPSASNSGVATENSTIVRVSGIKIFDCQNVYAAAPTGTAGEYAADSSVVVDFTSTAASPNRPGDKMRGDSVSFAQGQGSTNYWGYPGLQNDGLNTQAEFRSDLSRQLHLIDGTAGARLREENATTPASGALVSYAVAA